MVNGEWLKVNGEWCKVNGEKSGYAHLLTLNFEHYS